MSDPQENTDPNIPRDAATLVIVDRSRDTPRVLMGQRRATQAFMPNKYVFPGGRVDAADAAISHDGALSREAVDSLMHDIKGTASPERAHALALAALRETYEEAGLLFGKPISVDTVRPSKASWPAFEASGLRPSLNGLSFFARAITPPGRPRRYDTRFFTVDARHIAKRIPAPDDELRNLNWFTPEALGDLDVANITRKVLSDLIAWDRCQRDGLLTPQIPYYFFEDGSFQRVLVPRAKTAC